MYEKGPTIPMQSNASFVTQNLSLLNGPKGIITYATVSRNVVNLTTVDRHGAQLETKQVIPKISKDETTASANGPDNMLLASLIQTKFVKVSDRYILVICATKGIFFYDEDGSTLIYFHTFRDMRASQMEETNYAKGITVVGTNLIGIGTSSASILLFEVPPKGNGIVLVDEIKNFNSKNLPSAGITDLISSSDWMISSDTNGNIFGWQIRPEKKPKLVLDIHGNKNAVTCMGLWRSNLIVGYGNGLVSIFDVETGKKLVDISAHARWIHCLSVTGTGTFVTAGADSFFRVWELNEVNGKLKVNAMHSELIADTQMCGIIFNYGTEHICIACFDSSEILIYSSP